MKRLTAADSWYLYAETPTMHTHVCGAVVLDPTDSPRETNADSLYEHVADVLPKIEGFGDRLLEVPFGVDHPVWATDETFTMERHVKRHTLRLPGGDEELGDFIGELASTPLDRSIPLWEMYIVDGLMGGRIALVSKMHHTLIDGISGVDMMMYLLSFEPDGDPLPVPEIVVEPEDAVLDHIPNPVQLTVDAAINRLSTPGRSLKALRRTAEGISKAARTVVGQRRAGEATPGPFMAPRTPWNATLTAERAVAFSQVSLDDVKATKAAMNVSLNDIVLSACTIGLRNVLAREGESFDKPLVAAIPVSVHGSTSEENSGAVNQVSNLFAHLPVNLGDSKEIVDYVHAVTAGAKELHADLGPDILGDLVDLVPPPLFHLGVDAMSRARVPDYTPPVQSTIISNVPGSPMPLYMAGAEVVGILPFGPLIEGCGLNITVISHMDQLHIGLIGCPDLIPDLEGMLEEIVEGFEGLHKLALNT